MTAPSPAARLHELLLAAAAQSPAAVVTGARHALAAGELVPAAEAVLAEAGAGRLAITPADQRLLGELLPDNPAVGRLRPGPATAEPVAYDFLPLLPTSADQAPPMLLDLTADDRPAVDEVDVAALTVIGDLPGARALWRAWRFGGDQPPARLFIAEVEGDDLPAVAERLRAALVAAGEEHPLVEVYGPGTPLPDHQRSARGRAALLWSAEPTEPVVVARVFDRVDPRLGPLFEPEHPTLTAADQPRRLLDYLNGGTVLLATTERMADVLDPSLGPAVPMSYRTDGTWIWTDTVTYYLTMYGLSPDAELVDHIRARDHILPDVSAAAAHRALAVLIGPPAA